MISPLPHSLRAVTLFACCAVSITCSSDRSPGVAGVGTNVTRTLLVDDPFPYSRVARVDLYIVSVSASLSPDTGATAAGGAFVTLATPNMRVNLLDLQNGITAELGSASLATGAFTAVRVIIDTDSSSITLKNGQVLTGSSNPGIHWQSSAGRPQIDALIDDQITVPDTGGLVVIDYDVGRAFVTPQEIDPSSTDSGFIFSPVVHAADAHRTGSISGSVRAHTATGASVADASLRLYLGKPGNPEDTWSVLSTAKTDSNGVFRFPYVTRSAFWAALAAHAGDTYIVAIDPPAGSGLGRILIPSVTVTIGTDTPLGVIILP